MLKTFLVAAMAAWQPPVHAGDLDRYAEIANDIVEVALDPTEDPIEVFEDSRRERTALLMAATAFFESQYRADVDDGRVKGDGGVAHCLMQVHLRPGESVSTRRECLRLGLARLRESFSMCRFRPVQDRLGAYVRGRCQAEDPVSRRRWAWAQRYWMKHRAELEAP